MKYDLEERTASFAVNVIKLCSKINKTVLTIPIVDQLIRSGTSIGANYIEACDASSKKDFKNKVYICKKESMETKYWLRVLSQTSPALTKDCRVLWREAQELTLIFSTITKNTI